MTLVDTVLAEYVSPRDIVYKCAYCHNRHRHGSDNDMSSRDIHRVSECSVNNTTPLMVRITGNTKRYCRTQRNWARPGTKGHTKQV